MKIIKKIKGKQDGFSVLELAIVALIIAVLGAAVLALLNPWLHAARIMETREKMGKIEAALNAFAIGNSRLPCAAEPRRGAVGEPYGYADGSGTAGDAVPALCVLTQGMVPFRTLGLPEDMVVDGWGRYMTYAVSPAFTVYSTARGNVAPNVHAACRTREWLREVLLPNGDNAFENRNPHKARFCCPDETNGPDLVVRDDADANVLAVPRAAGPYGYAPPDTKMDPYDMSAVPPVPYNESRADIEANRQYYLQPQVPLPQFRATAIAYVLVSHGPDGNGAFAPAINGGTLTDARVGFDAAERQGENADNDNVFVAHADSVALEGNTKIDDIVSWRTQDAIFAEEGDSCASP